VVPTLTSGRIQVFTYKEGLLSPIAHDLRLRLDRFEISHDEAEVEGRFWPDSLVVEGAIEQGRLNENVLSAAQREEILDNVRRKILHTDAHPEARLLAKVVARGETYEVIGTLELAGSPRPVSLVVRATDRRLQGDLELRPSQWGIKPFRALLGAIRLADRVRVHFDLPDERLRDLSQRPG
jgi:hypothetical protein